MSSYQTKKSKGNLPTIPALGQVQPIGIVCNFCLKDGKKTCNHVAQATWETITGVVAAGMAKGGVVAAGLFGTPSTELQVACYAGYSGRVLTLLLQHKNDPDFVNESNEKVVGKPLIFAIHAGHVKIVELLIKHKANPMLYTKVRGAPLTVAAENGNLQIIQLLLDNLSFKDLTSKVEGDKTLGAFAQDKASQFKHYQAKNLISRAMAQKKKDYLEKMGLDKI